MIIRHNITAGAYRLSESISVVIAVAMLGDIHGETHTVGDCEPQSPLVLENILHIAVAKSWDTIDRIIAGHYTSRLTVDNGISESSKVVLMLKTGRNIGIAFQPVVLIIIGVEVLQRRDSEHILLIISGKSAGIGGGHLTGEAYVLTVSLLSASPARIALQIHSRAPHTQLTGTAAVVVSARLGTGNSTDSLHQLSIESTGKTDRLRENGRVPVVIPADESAGDLSTDVKLLHTKPRNGVLKCTEQTCFFLKCQLSRKLFSSCSESVIMSIHKKLQSYRTA